MKKRTMFMRAFGFVAIFMILFVFVTEVLKDKRIEGEYNPTTKVRGFYAEDKNTLDFVFIGSSQVYADIAPAVLYRDYGMTSYDFTANEQPMWISYYYIKEALKRQNPKAIVLDVFTVYGADYEEEGVNHINLDDLPWSLNKIQAIKMSVPKELRSSFYFEIAKYHTTWEGLDEAKFNATFAYGKDPMKGYSPFVVAAQYESQAKAEVVAQKECEEIPEKAKEWLYKIIELTREEGVDLVLMKTPNGNAERQKLYNSVAQIAKQEQIPFINMNTIFDGEAHINVLQAEKVTQYIGAYLAEHYEIDDKRGDENGSEWEESVALFERYRQKCVLLEKESLSDYLQELEHESNYVVMTCGTVSEESDSCEEIAQLDSLFGQHAENTTAQEGYVAIFKAGKLVKESRGNGKPHIKENLSGHSFSIVMNCSEDSETKISIKSDDIDYAMADTQNQIVVYDMVLNEVVDVVGFDIDSGMIVR